MAAFLMVPGLLGSLNALEIFKEISRKLLLFYICVCPVNEGSKKTDPRRKRGEESKTHANGSESSTHRHTQQNLAFDQHRR